MNMDIIVQKCNVCGAVNADNALTWVRIFGATLGNSPNPIIAMQRATPGQIRPAGTPPMRLMLDFCPACAAKTTVTQVPGLYAAKNQATAIASEPAVKS